MKKFLAFLISIIVIACLGVVFYQFAKNDEVIKVEAQTIYINYGETISLDDIGFSRHEASSDTKIDFNAGGEEVTSIIKYDAVSECYIPTAKGGSTTIKISTNNRKYKTFAIDVIVGVGTEEHPYYISNEDQLFSIGSELDLNSYFKLVNDIYITKEHSPIGSYLDEDVLRYAEFKGHFDGGYNSINNLKITSCNHGGLFGILGDGSSVSNLEINKATISGEFSNAGTIAGICRGIINRVIVNESAISNTKAGAYTGGIAGKLETDETVSLSTMASILRTGINSSSQIIGYGYVGGIAGFADSSKLLACFAQLSLTNKSNKSTGGIVGQFNVDSSSYIRECYSVLIIDALSGPTGNIVGTIDLSGSSTITSSVKNKIILGNYYNKEYNKYSSVGKDSYSFGTSTPYAANGKTESEMKKKNTYIYYINSSNEVIYWENVWHVVDGEYPSLTYANKFVDITLDNPSSSLPNAPDDETPDTENPSDNPSSTNIIISNKDELISYFQSSDSVAGNYTLNGNINLEGIVWNPINFQGTFKSAGSNTYTISNFKIDSKKKRIGFFATLGNSHIENIVLKNVKIESDCSCDAAGILVGYIYGDTTIKNVSTIYTSINATAIYAGGLVGYSGDALVKISNGYISSLNISGKANNAGGVIGYASTNNSLSGYEVTAYGDGITAYKRVGGIASTNYGVINKCNFLGNISSLDQVGTDAYFAGIASVNYGTLKNCINNANISVNNTSSSQSYFVGGVCGYNLGMINVCAVETGGGLQTEKNSTRTYIAGIVGYNTSSVVKSGCRTIEIGSSNSNTAGIAAYNYGGSIAGCSTSSNLVGNTVAGLVLYNTDRGIVYSCYAGKTDGSRVIYKGKNISSLTSEINSGKIYNSMVSADLQCTNPKGYIAGFAAFLPYTSGVHGIIENCVANVNMSGVGDKYLLSCEMDLMKKEQTTGSIKYCIISKDAYVDNVIVSEESKDRFLFWDTKTHTPGSKSSCLVASDSELHSIDTYTRFEIGCFDIDSVDNSTIFEADKKSSSIWYFNPSTKLPIPRMVNDNTSLYPMG